jgi:CDP-glycerol glycerophosphotransferase (TagB/SpsB family)
MHRLFKIILKIPRYLSDSLMILFWRLRSLFFSEKEKFIGAWLICERGIEARDNGFALFKYIRENYPNKKVYYLIDSTQEIDYKFVENLGNIINYNSKEHWMSLFFVDCLLSTHVGFITPWSYVCHKTFFSWLNCPKFVLLNHGITKEDMSDKLNKFVTGVDLFIAANNQDYTTLVQDKRYGYNSKDVALTGYARYDRWVNYEGKNQILLMPTWRAYLVDKSISNRNEPKVIDNFVQSSYYKAFQNLLNNELLDQLLEENNIQLIFYPHYEMQSALYLWTTKSKNIIFANKQNYDIPTLMRESKLLITDYSGVGFDFAYMYKPVLYYQFDKEEYYRGHYLHSEVYSMEEDGLGSVVCSEHQLMEELRLLLEDRFVMPSKYRKRVDDFFTYHDNKNCERIYKAVISMLE